MAKLILTKEAEKDFNKLKKQDQKKVIRKLKILEQNPNLGKSLTGKLQGFYSFKAWPYRILYEFYQSDIYVYRILHRQGAYK